MTVRDGAAGVLLVYYVDHALIDGSVNSISASVKTVI